MWLWERRAERLPPGPYPGTHSGEVDRFEARCRHLAEGHPLPPDTEETNGLVAYVEASFAAQYGQLPDAIARLRIGNAAPYVRACVRENPGSYACEALPLLRSLRHQALELLKLDEAAYEELLVSGRRIAVAEPVSMLNLLVGAAHMKSVLKAGVQYSRQEPRFREVSLSACRLMAPYVNRTLQKLRPRAFSVYWAYRRLLAGTGASEEDFQSLQRPDMPMSPRIEALKTRCELEYRIERARFDPFRPPFTDESIRSACRR